MAIEGDENTRYFHGVLNRKRSQLNIRGIMVDGKWTEKPNNVKLEFLHHFRNRFDKPVDNRVHIYMNFSKSITIDQQMDLECVVSKEELKRAMWECGTAKSPGPDGFSFGFYRQFWSSIENDVFVAVSHFFTFGDIPNGCNSCFIALIPKVSDANLVKDFRPISLIGSMYKIIAKILANRLVGVLEDIVNEKKQSLIFKVDFEKAYDSVRCDFLDDVLKEFGFGNKWCAWIQSCLRSSRGSIIINGSPTEEFQFFKGLKQGDLLSPFLFILIMESLHLSFQRVVDVGMFKGINLSLLVNLYHMFYADDAVFVGQWCDETEKELTVNSEMSDTRWVWSLEGSGEFSVVSIRKIIDDNRLSTVDTRTLWIKYVPIKVNVLAWKIKIEALPTRFNISRRCMDIDSIICPICECEVESARHVFFSCSLVRQIGRKVCSWWDVMYIDVNSYVEWFNWMNSLRLKSKSKLMKAFAIMEFFSSGTFSKGCDFSFIALIPKTRNAKTVKDFRPISLIGSLYKMIAKILANRLSSVIPDLISDVQSVFISNRQILDGQFILNELLSWCNYKKLKAMVFKVDFKKAFDSIRWDYLDDVLKSFGFGDKWRGWISGCLKSAIGYVLVNESPTPEFQFHRGLKQGDPLSPFLFILIMESLHLSFKKVMNAGLFTGISLDNSLTISHLFYADDAIFVGKWDSSNLKIILKVFKCFHMVSGLKININKSKLMGFGMHSDEVETAARYIGCATFIAHFSHLGVKVGGRMEKINSWDDVVSKVTSRLSKWKFKKLSIGGRLTLIKSALTSIPLYQMSSFKVTIKVLNILESIRRKFFNGIEGNERKLALISWDTVLASKKYGDSWFDEISLKQQFPRLYSLESAKHINVAEKMNHPSLSWSYRREPRGGIEEEQQNMLFSRISGVILPNMRDRWIWSFEASGDFSVTSARSLIDDYLLPKRDVQTRWVKVVPIKINVFAWSVRLDKLHTRLNLS
nr:RNA-directed DNA polymerase, eukaryota [Tanacetum cinerariifolium]